MDVAQELDELRSAVPGCDLVAFVDLGSMMVFATSADDRPPQEELDRLGVSAQLLLDGALPQEVQAITFPGEEDAVGNFAILATGHELRIFQRSLTRPAEAIVGICSTDCDVAILKSAFGDFLERVEDSESAADIESDTA